MTRNDYLTLIYRTLTFILLCMDSMTKMGLAQPNDSQMRSLLIAMMNTINIELKGKLEDL